MWADLRAAFSFLTILPLGYADGRKPGWSFAWYPLVGACIGLMLALVAAYSPFAPMITAFLVVLVWVILTGGLHLDGFGDSCDGVLATVNPERRLEIMKDPRTGTWAVAGIVLLLLGKWVSVTAIHPALLLLPPVLGRWGMVLAAYAFPYGRASGLGGYFKDGLGRVQVGIATGLMLVVVGLMAWLMTPWVIALVPLVGGLVWALGLWVMRRLGGGLTGDIYGALCELTELACLMGLSLWASA